MKLYKNNSHKHYNRHEIIFCFITQEKQIIGFIITFDCLYKQFYIYKANHSKINKQMPTNSEYTSDNITGIATTTYTPKKHQQYIFAFQLLGTLLFTYATGCSHHNLIGQTSNFIHCFSLVLPLALSGQISGGYFNPFITLAAYINKRHNLLKAYLGAQVIGGLVGTTWFWLLTGRMVAGYEHQNGLEMTKFILNEAIGAFFLSVCVLGLTNKYTTRAFKSWQIYITIAASLYLIRKMTDDTPLNPVACIFYQLGSFIKTGNTMYVEYIWVLIVPAVVGGVVGGVFMYKVYEPLSLYVKFKNYDFQNDCEFKDNQDSGSSLTKDN